MVPFQTCWRILHDPGQRALAILLLLQVISSLQDDQLVHLQSNLCFWQSCQDLQLPKDDLIQELVPKPFLDLHYAGCLTLLHLFLQMACLPVSLAGIFSLFDSLYQERALTCLIYHPHCHLRHLRIHYCHNRLPLILPSVPFILLTEVSSEDLPVYPPNFL